MISFLAALKSGCPAWIAGLFYAVAFCDLEHIPYPRAGCFFVFKKRRRLWNRPARTESHIFFLSEAGA